MAELEHAGDNVRAALAWSMSADGVLAVAVDLAGALGWFWLMSGRLEEAGSWYAALLARRGSADNTLAWAKVLHGSALQCWGRGDVAQAAPLEESAVQIFRSAGDNRWLAYGLTVLSRVRTHAGEIDLIARSPDGILCFVEVKARQSLLEAREALFLRDRRRDFRCNSAAHFPS